MCSGQSLLVRDLFRQSVTARHSSFGCVLSPPACCLRMPDTQNAFIVVGYDAGQPRHATAFVRHDTILIIMDVGGEREARPLRANVPLRTRKYEWLWDGASRVVCVACLTYLSLTSFFKDSHRPRRNFALQLRAAMRQLCCNFISCYCTSVSNCW